MNRSVKGLVTFLLHYNDKRTRCIDVISYGRDKQNLVQNAWVSAMHTVLSVPQPNLVKTEVSAVNGTALNYWLKDKEA